MNNVERLSVKQRDHGTQIQAILRVVCLILVACTTSRCAVGSGGFVVPINGSVASDRAVVIGSLVVKPQNGVNPVLEVFSTDSGNEVTSFSTSVNGGYFALALPVGKYIILDADFKKVEGEGGYLLGIGDVHITELDRPIRLTFEITRPQTLSYIGMIDLRDSHVRIVADTGGARSYAAQFQALAAFPVVDASPAPDTRRTDFIAQGFVEPVSPMPMTGFYRGFFKMQSHTLEDTPEKVTGQHPTLRWRSVQPTNGDFDLIIFQASTRAGWGIGSMYFVPGIEVYYREGLHSTEHAVDKELKPGWVYVWGVRRRQGDKVGPWSSYKLDAGGTFLGPNVGPTVWWPFEMPASAAR